MAPENTLDRQDELLIAVVLNWSAHDFDQVHPQQAERTGEIARMICEKHGLDPGEAVLEL